MLNKLFINLLIILVLSVAYIIDEAFRSNFILFYFIPLVPFISFLLASHKNNLQFMFPLIFASLIIDFASRTFLGLCFFSIFVYILILNNVIEKYKTTLSFLEFVLNFIFAFTIHFLYLREYEINFLYIVSFSIICVLSSLLLNLASKR